MRLRGREGNELELSVVGYQVPDETVDPWESNSLLVALRVVSPKGRWEVVDPCLTTWETARLGAWLAAVAAAPTVGTRSLAEPNLSVAVSPAGGRLSLRICFELENRPPWAPTVSGGRDLCVDLDVSRADLLAAAASLRADARRFPRRGDDPTL
ncbi:MAG TPA: hypothetical protein VG455_00070 [Acidimicrobiales bacterium]|nr:hypothetical protein [Acidimicrobiales bacterium]